MNQQIGANLNEAHLMLTTSIFDEQNKKIIEKISDEHRQPVKTEKQEPSFFMKVWSYIIYPFTCCLKTYNNKREIKYDDFPSSTTITPSTSFNISSNPVTFIDNGQYKIPVDIFEERLNALKSERDRQDREFLSNIPSKEDAKKQFDEFNRIPNEEINAQFKQMQQEKGY